MKQNVSLFFPETIYPQSVILQAIQDYAEICRIKLRRTGGGVECVFLKSIAAPELTAMEFSNYLIELINAGGSE